MTKPHKSSEDLIAEAKESLRKASSRSKSSRRKPEAERTSQVTSGMRSSTPPRVTKPGRPAESEPRTTGRGPKGPRPTDHRSAESTQPAPRESPQRNPHPGLWKLISFISLGWVALVTVSIASAIADQPDDALELILGAVVIALIPLLIGIYAVRRARRDRAQVAEADS